MAIVKGEHVHARCGEARDVLLELLAHARWGDLKMGRLAEGNSTAWNIIVEHSS